MRDRMKRLAAVFLAVALLAVPVQAKEREGLYIDLAQVLYEAGFFKGRGTGATVDFALEEALTRAEGAVMLVRMLGREAAAQEEGFSHPFDDVPSWADPYVGYLYEQGLTKGIGVGKFGSSGLVTADQYFTFMLRALGYDEANGDFEWDRSLEKALQLGMVDSEEFTGFKTLGFLRGHAVLAAYRGLLSQVKDGSGTLVESLYEKGDIEADALEAMETEVEGSMPVEGVDAKELLVLGDYAFRDLEGVAISETLDFHMSATDAASGETMTVMEAAVQQAIHRSAKTGEASAATDTQMLFFGIEATEYKEVLAQPDHLYVYKETATTFDGGEPEVVFGDFRGDGDYAQEAALAWRQTVMALDFESITLEGLPSFAAMAMEETETEYVLTATEGVAFLLNDDENLEGATLTAADAAIRIDKATGIITSCILSLEASDDAGSYATLEYSFTAAAGDWSPVPVPPMIRERL